MCLADKKVGKKMSAFSRGEKKNNRQDCDGRGHVSSWDWILFSGPVWEDRMGKDTCSISLDVARKGGDKNLLTVVGSVVTETGKEFIYSE